jgi:hypothetical protein
MDKDYRRAQPELYAAAFGKPRLGLGRQLDARRGQRINTSSAFESSHISRPSVSTLPRFYEIPENGQHKRIYGTRNTHIL